MRTFVALAALLATPALAASAPMIVDRAEIRASLRNVPTAAAYMTIRNGGAEADRLLGASCACAASVTAHETVHANGVARMVPTPAVAVPSRGSVAFAPGGRHLMLMGLKAPIRAGARVPITLRFEKAGAISVTFTATDTPGHGDHHH